MSTVKLPCEYCGGVFSIGVGQLNRANRIKAPLYCGRRCAGLARRSGKTKAELREEKRLYDLNYCAANREQRLVQKREYHKRTYDPVKAAAYRKERMALHVEYCRQPEYRAKKHEYDKRRYADQFGPFAECVGLLQELNAEIATRMSRYDIYMANGRYDKYHERRKERRLSNG